MANVRYATALNNGVQTYWNSETNAEDTWDGTAPAPDHWRTEIPVAEWSEAVMMLNKKRMQVGCQNLLLFDNDVAHHAQDYADQLAIWDPAVDKTVIKDDEGWHASDRDVFAYGEGECLYHANSRPDENKPSIDIPVKGGAELFLSEEKLYHGESTFGPATSDCRHFTQVVWDDSFKIGIGKTTSRSGYVYVVYRFWLAGNNGQYPNDAYAAAAGASSRWG